MKNLVDELLRVCGRADSIQDESDWIYVKTLLLEIARTPTKDGSELERLGWNKCWPCQAPKAQREYRYLHDFYVDDVGNLPNDFFEQCTFLNLDVDSSEGLSDLLSALEFEQFISEHVEIETKAEGSLRLDRTLTRDLRGRADALTRYSNSFALPPPSASLTHSQVL